MDEKPFIIASDGMLRADAMTTLPTRRVLFLFNDDELAAEAEAHLPDGASVARYDMREEGFPATAAGEADVIFLAVKDDPRMLLVLRATKRCFRFSIYSTAQK